MKSAPSKSSRSYLVLLFVVLCQAAVAADVAPGKAAIASAYPLATEAGLQVLRAGGNAFDAAVAVSAALAVVEPTGSGLAGGGMFLLHRASDGANIVIDAREVAPGAATRDMYLDKSGSPIRGLSTNTALAAGISGEPAGLGLLQSKYGKLPLAESLKPAIRLARDGFDLYPRLQAGLVFKKGQLGKSPEAAKIWLIKGEAAPVGTRIRQPQLARTLQTLAREGMASFYTGSIAKQMVDGVRELGGIWTAEDLANYKAIERAPIVGQYRGAKIISAPPPSSGGIALVEALNVLSGFEMQQLDDVTRKHVIVEAMRRMHRDRAVYLGDPAFTQVPVQELIDPHYAAGLRTSIRLDRATPSAMLAATPESASAGMQTTHFSVLDKDGNRVAGTITLNTGWGTGLTVRGTGLILNNQMDDFSIKPGVPNVYGLIGASANEIAPGKRMLSSITPTFVESPRGFMIVGSPGGSYITGMVLLATLDWIDGKSAQQIVAAPRIHHQYQPDVLAYETAALTTEEVAELTRRGHKLRQAEGWGNLQVVTYDAATGAVSAASDPRGVGTSGIY
ncbi:MAG TPA: gamma-glutamyltransferase [Steroidobacteraceae bacterium]|nr:gamma-glutamyltransferase [Steroidobacteraceae bacterium]